MCGQLTLIGYFLIRGCKYQTLILFPLPVCTVIGMQTFKKHYADPSKVLSLERAREYDRVADAEDDPNTTRPAGGMGLDSPRNGFDSRRRNFDKNCFRQPVLTERVVEPLPYRRGKDDEMTKQARELLGHIRRLAEEHSLRHSNPSDPIDRSEATASGGSASVNAPKLTVLV